MREVGSLETQGSVPGQGRATPIVSGCKGGYSPPPPLHGASVVLTHAQGTHPPHSICRRSGLTFGRSWRASATCTSTKSCTWTLK